MILLLAAAMATAAVPPPMAGSDLAGLYVTRQMEMAGALELRSDGRFRYQLDYGAASEMAEGDWTVRDGKVQLTSNPMPKLPDFSLVADEPAAEGELYVHIEESGFSWSPIDVLVTLEGSGEVVPLQAGAGGLVPLPAGQRATSLRLVVPVYSIAGTPVPLSPGKGHRLLFRFQPNELGKAAFRSEPLAIDGGSLVMRRYDTTIVFRPAEQ